MRDFPLVVPALGNAIKEKACLFKLKPTKKIEFYSSTQLFNRQENHYKYDLNESFLGYFMQSFW